MFNVFFCFVSNVGLKYEFIFKVYIWVVKNIWINGMVVNLMFCDCRVEEVENWGFIDLCICSFCKGIVVVICLFVYLEFFFVISVGIVINNVYNCRNVIKVLV